MSKKVISRSSVIGLKVYTQDAKFVGVVKDLGIDLSDPANMQLEVEREGRSFFIPIKYIGAVGDIILLKEGAEIESFEAEAKVEAAAPAEAPSAAEVKPKPAAPQPTVTAVAKPKYEIARCSKCGSALIYYPQYGRWYCPKCRSYVEVPQTVLARVPRCSTCGNYLSYIEQYGRWYCYHCNKYVEVPS